MGRLHTDLQNKGIRCWFAPEDMKIGDRIRSRIDEVIHLHEKLLLVLSEHSIRSDWVEKEVETAFEKEREGGSTVLFPVRLDDAILESRTGWAADIKRSRHIGDPSPAGRITTATRSPSTACCATSASTRLPLPKLPAIEHQPFVKPCLPSCHPGGPCDRGTPWRRAQAGRADSQDHMDQRARWRRRMKET